MPSATLDGPGPSERALVPCARAISSTEKVVVMIIDAINAPIARVDR